VAYSASDKVTGRSFDFKGNLRRVVCTLGGVETFNGIELLKQTKGKFDYTAQHLAMRIAGSATPHLERERLRSKM